MKLIAITGASYTGKTRLGTHLEDYIIVGFSERLKIIAAEALRHLTDICAIPAYYDAKTERIHREKERYRAFLIGLGQAIGYDRDPVYIEGALERWYDLGRPAAYFDNVRSTEQADYLRTIGFQIVELVVPFAIRKQRAERSGGGLTEARAEADMRLPDSYVVDLTLDGTAPSSVIAKQLIRHE